MLTDTKLRSAKPRAKPYKLTDGKRSYALVKPSGTKLFQMVFTWAGATQTLSYGTYPDQISLADFRDRRDVDYKLVHAGKDPRVVKAAEKATNTDTFKLVASEWLQRQRTALDPVTLEKAQWVLQDLLYPYIGDRPLRELQDDAPALLAPLRALEARGKIETAHRARGRISQVFKYAISTRRATHNPATALADALTPLKVTHRAAITEPKRVGELLRAISGYHGQPSVHYALRILPYVFVRVGELRLAEWDEFTLDGPTLEWRIPGPRMKMREAHIVPLAPQVVELLKELRLISTGRLLFPSLTSGAKPISDATLGAALRRLGYTSSEMTPHGFRTIASTLLNELGHNGDLIELQLAHKPRNAVRAAYNRAERLTERRAMMKAWANYLDGLRSGANVVAFKQSA